jgi:NTE family protein
LDEFLDKQPAQPEDGIGLALSGGGYRAMVFHVGALIRLNEVALLRKIKRISSVSGGSITAGVLGTSWKDLKFTDDVAVNFVVERVGALLRAMEKAKRARGNPGADWLWI